MSIFIPTHNEELMPMHMGLVLRVPSDDWKKYGVRWDSDRDFISLISLGRNQYMLEYANGDTRQHTIIEDASKSAFEGIDYNSLLQDKNAEIVHVHLKNKPDGKYVIFEIGSGNGASALKVWKRIRDDREFNSEVEFVLADPARKTLRKAREDMKAEGATVRTLNIRQDEIPIRYGKNKADVMMQVAAIHHDPKIPFDAISGALKEGGLFSSADWHHETWQEPGLVYEFLKTLEWDKKDDGLKNWKTTYGLKDDDFSYLMPKDPAEAKAIKDIWKFWGSYLIMLHRGIGSYGNNSIWPLESHQVRSRYGKGLNDSGISTDIKSGYLKELTNEVGIKNPYSVSPGTNIASTYVGIRTSN